jgi:hypothetical protein
MVSDIPAGDGKIANLFLECMCSELGVSSEQKKLPFLNYTIRQLYSKTP